MNFTYRIKWTLANVSYYGVRYKEGADTTTLMTSYFTSSKYVHRYIKMYGLPDVIEIRKVFCSKLAAKHWEERVINKGRLHSAKNWLNCGNNGSFKNIVMDDDMKKRISACKKVSNSKKPKRAFYNNGFITKSYYVGETIPVGFVPGRIQTENIKKHVDHLQNIRKNRSSTDWQIITQKISQSTKGVKKPDGFADKISKAHKGLIKPHMLGDTNPSKTIVARRKISESWENREKIYWFVNRATNEGMCLREEDLANVDTSIWTRGKPISGEWYNNGSENMWVRHDNREIDRAAILKGKIKRIVPVIWITNGTDNKRISIDADIPYGFTIGRTLKIKAGEFKYYNNGIKNITVNIDQPVPDGFVPGKMKRSTHEAQQT